MLQQTSKRGVSFPFPPFFQVPNGNFNVELLCVCSQIQLYKRLVYGTLLTFAAAVGLFYLPAARVSCLAWEIQMRAEGRDARRRSGREGRRAPLLSVWGVRGMGNSVPSFHYPPRGVLSPPSAPPASLFKEKRNQPRPRARALPLSLSLLNFQSAHWPCIIGPFFNVKSSD